MPSIRRYFLLLLLLAAWLAGCSPIKLNWPTSVIPPSSAWQYADVRLVDGDDPVPPGQDLLAVYARNEPPDLRLRVDLLEAAALPDYDLYIAIDSRPGGRRDLPLNATAGLDWDTLLVLPASGGLQARRADGSPLPGSALFVLRDPLSDSLDIRLRRQALESLPAGLSGRLPAGPQSPLRLQVFTTLPGSKEVTDQAGPLITDGPPPAPAQALFAFWNAYPAYTPITALRRWDGAHTGPLGGRHGLNNLLRTARAAGIPLALLDLNRPAALSALDYAGGLELAKAMAQAGQLELPLAWSGPAYAPFSIPAKTASALAAQNQETAAAFGLPGSRAAYLPPGSQGAMEGAALLFERTAPVSDPGAATPGKPVNAVEQLGSQKTWPVPERRGRQAVIPLPGEFMQPAPNQAYTQAGRNGLELDWRRLLARAALECAGQNCFLPLGGDLPASAWGDPEAARAAFKWLKAHPWVRVVTAEELAAQAQTRPADNLPAPQAAPDPPLEDAGLNAALQAAPDNPLGQAAWQAYAALAAPVYPYSPGLPALRAGYTGQVWSLLGAAEWAAGAGPGEFVETQNLASLPSRIDCSTDPDHDGTPECILANDNIFAQVEIDDGTLTGLYYRSAGGAAHQVIGPSSQFITGLSDPQTWQTGGGAMADPAVIPGAFSGPGSGYRAEVQGDALLLTGPDGGSSKLYRLTPQGLNVEYRLAGAAPAVAARIPLALDPWLRFQPGWNQGYGAERTHGDWDLWAGGNPAAEQVRVKVRSPAPSRLLSFQDSAGLFAGPEDPNREFPGGHLLPFPLQVVELAIPPGAPALSVDIMLK